MLLRELAAIPTVAPYTWEVWRDGSLFKAELVHEDENTWAKFTPDEFPAPYLFVARPWRRELPRLEIGIEPGDAPLWRHNARLVMEAFGGSVTRIETLVFGRKRADGREEVWQAFPDGQVGYYTSSAEALT